MDSKMNSGLSLIILCLLSSLSLAAQKQTHTQKQTDETLRRAFQYFDEKKYDSALVCLHRLEARDSGNPDIKYEIAFAYALKREHDTAITMLEKLKDHPKASDKYFRLLANLYSERDDSVHARETLEKGVKRFAQSGTLHLELGLLQLQQRHLDEALDEFEEGIQVDPTFMLNYYWAARSYSTGNEKIWTVLYAELLMNLDPSPTRASVTSSLLYNMHNSVYEEFRTTKRMVYSRARKGSTDDTQAAGPSFEDVVNELMTKGAAELQFFQDFEIPIASIDTMQTEFVRAWYKNGYDKKFPNAAIERHKQFLDKGMHTAYTYFLMQFAKPLECKAYLDKHRKEYDAFMRWFKEHPLRIDDSNRFSRFIY